MATTSQGVRQRSTRRRSSLSHCARGGGGAGGRLRRAESAAKRRAGPQNTPPKNLHPPPPTRIHPRTRSHPPTHPPTHPVLLGAVCQVMLRGQHHEMHAGQRHRVPKGRVGARRLVIGVVAAAVAAPPFRLQLLLERLLLLGRLQGAPPLFNPC